MNDEVMKIMQAQTNECIQTLLYYRDIYADLGPFADYASCIYQCH